jgi:hypothetical protein
MQIIVVTPKGDEVAIDVAPTDTIHDVKSKVSEKTGIPAHQQQLNFQGEILDEGASLTAIGAVDGTRLEMTWAFSSSSTSTTAAPTSSTPSSFLAPRTDSKSSMYIALAVILPFLFISTYAWRVQAQKKRSALTKVQPIQVVTEPLTPGRLKLWDGPKSPFAKPSISFKSTKSRASIATTPDYKSDARDMDSSLGSDFSLPHLLGTSSPQHIAQPVKSILRHTAGGETNRKLNSWQTAHNKHFPDLQTQQQEKMQISKSVAHQKRAARATDLHAKASLGHAMQKTSASPSIEVTLHDLELRHAARPSAPEHAEVTLQDSGLRHAARETCTASTPEVTEAHLSATSAVRAPPPLPKNIRPPIEE